MLGDLQLDSRRLQRLVYDLLALEREDAAPAPRQPVRLDHIVAEAIAGRSRARAQAGEPVTVMGEPEALRRALDNLLDNAEVHGPAEGEIVVALRLVDGEAMLTVSDEGPGLDPAEAQHAFDRFWRGSEAAGKPGSGLGLALVRATARRHAGEASVAGSTVTITLPAIGGSARRTDEERTQPVL